MRDHSTFKYLQCRDLALDLDLADLVLGLADMVLLAGSDLLAGPSPLVGLGTGRGVGRFRVARFARTRAIVGPMFRPIIDLLADLLIVVLPLIQSMSRGKRFKRRSPLRLQHPSRPWVLSSGEFSDLCFGSFCPFLGATSDIIVVYHPHVSTDKVAIESENLTRFRILCFFVC